MILSAYRVESEPARGYAGPCWWPAVSLAHAVELARQLSEEAANDWRYPNAFWIMAEGSYKPLCKFYRGQRYAPGDTI